MKRAMGVVALGLALALALPSVAEASKRGKVEVTGTVNLNHATAEQLDLLPGVGEKTAKVIIAYREKHPFGRIEELVKVKGFGKKRFQKLKPYLSISGETTLQQTAGPAEEAEK